MAAKVSKQKVHRFKITQEEVFEEYFEDMKCLACVSTLQPFQFTHLLNALLDLDLRQEVEGLDKDKVSYKVYTDFDTVRNIQYAVICNRNKSDFYMPELLNSDYVILMNGMTLHADLFQLTLEVLKTQRQISYTYTFDPHQLKSKEYLINSLI